MKKQLRDISDLYNKRNSQNYGLKLQPTKTVISQIWRNNLKTLYNKAREISQ